MRAVAFVVAAALGSAAASSAASPRPAASPKPGTSKTAAATAAPSPSAASSDDAPRHLEALRLRAAAVYVGTVGAIRRLGSLDGLDGETQGRMEAAVQVAKVLRGAAPPSTDLALRFDSRAPDPEGDGYYTLAPGEAVLVFADQLAEPAYPLEMLHGPSASMAADVKELRDALLAMDADAMRLNGVTAATRVSQVRLYDQALAAIAQLPTSH